MIIIPDSSVWIPFFLKRPDAASEKLVRLIEVEADVCICGPTLTELLQGVRHDAQQRKMASILESFEFLPQSRDTFLRAGDIYRTCRANGFTIRSSMDCLIAATALEHDAYVLHNDRDFDAMAKFFPLKFF